LEDGVTGAVDLIHTWGNGSMAKARKKVILERQLGRFSEQLTLNLKNQSYRATVLSAIDASPKWLTGHQIAELSNLPYKRTVDALNALYNSGKVTRKGRTCTALWGSLQMEQSAKADFSLENLFRQFVTGRPTSNS
jgi:hypothetical protein